MTKRLLLLLLAASLYSAPVRANVPGGDGDRAPVKLHVHGEIYELTNGNVSVEIDGPSAGVESFKYHGAELVNKDGKHGHMYWSMDGGADYQNPSHAKCSVRVQTAETVDVGCKVTYAGSQPHAFDIDIHYVLRRGATGLYVYAILSHPASYPATGVAEWRMVWDTPTIHDHFLLEKIFIDTARSGPIPTPYDISQKTHTPIKEISVFHTGLFNGKMESKYSYNATYNEIGTFGYASDVNKLGAWIVMGGFEYYNDGPRKNDLTAVEGEMTHHFGRNHYGGTSIKVEQGEEWAKIFGPFLLYANAGAPADQLWKDAQLQAATEQKAWPYEWMAGVPEYPLENQRGSVSGKLSLKDPLKPKLTTADAWIGLAQPPEGKDFQNESKNYEYWARVKPDGSFTIPHARPGTYKLYAFANGEPDVYEHDDVKVTAGTDTDAGELQWDIARTGWLAWEIGVPDRDSREFRHGNNYFQPFLYKGFTAEFSNPLVFHIGSSLPARDWNYAQSNYQPPQGSPAPWPWQIDFTLPSGLSRDGSAELTVALAAANKAMLRVSVNGTSEGEWTPENNSGNGLLRQASHMKYSLHRFAIPMAALHEGRNMIELLQTNWKADDNYLSYDYLSLEILGKKP
ncbi:rhamnogalacturonan endolyase [Granulicella rosea]|uniref:rhamnogalacturonan endolyase n=1 Tax=Granulicella rosea TaxID=474952 RepID=A0A239K5D6_9BACT|nr:polysaccharide lyase family protein [Granulicella rosea]SNT12853.1 rhamnogalacturonan endolyase [Granulicella rosea]